MQHETVLMIFPLNLQMNIIARVLSLGSEGELAKLMVL